MLRANVAGGLTTLIVVLTSGAGDGVCRACRAVVSLGADVVGVGGLRVSTGAVVASRAWAIASVDELTNAGAVVARTAIAAPCPVRGTVAAVVRAWTAGMLVGVASSEWAVVTNRAPSTIPSGCVGRGRRAGVDTLHAVVAGLADASGLGLASKFAVVAAWARSALGVVGQTSVVVDGSTGAWVLVRACSVGEAVVGLGACNWLDVVAVKVVRSNLLGDKVAEVASRASAAISLAVLVDRDVATIGAVEGLVAASGAELSVVAGDTVGCLVGTSAHVTGRAVASGFSQSSSTAVLAGGAVRAVLNGPQACVVAEST